MDEGPSRTPGGRITHTHTPWLSERCGSNPCIRLTFNGCSIWDRTIFLGGVNSVNVSCCNARDSKVVPRKSLSLMRHVLSAQVRCAHTTRSSGVKRLSTEFGHFQHSFSVNGWAGVVGDYALRPRLKGNNYHNFGADVTCFTGRYSITNATRHAVSTRRCPCPHPPRRIPDGV
jgi:hypothetical protein